MSLAGTEANHLRVRRVRTDHGDVGAIAQGYVRAIDPEGAVSARGWERPSRDLLGVHVLFLSEHDLPDAQARARELLSCVPIVALTRGWRGLELLTRDGVHQVPSLPRAEVDPTGAGDVFAATFLVRYHETGDPLEAAAFGACAASCVVEGVGACRTLRTSRFHRASRGAVARCRS